MHQHQLEIYGGLNPAAEDRLRYFQNNTMDQYYDSECSDNEIDIGSQSSVVLEFYIPGESESDVSAESESDSSDESESDVQDESESDD